MHLTFRHLWFCYLHRKERSTSSALQMLQADLAVMPGDKGNITRLGTKGQTEIRHIQRFPLIHHGKSRFCDCQNNVTKFPSSSTMASPQQPWVVHHHHFLPSPGEKLNLYIFRFFRSRWENNTHKYTAGTAALSLQAPKNRSEIKFPRSTCDLKGGK